MRVLVQWAQLNPQDWVETNSTPLGWQALPALPEPPSGILGGITDTLGWIFALNIQGVTFSGYDHYAIEDVDAETIRVTIWKDDPIDYPATEFLARQWTIKHLARDPERGDGFNTRQSQVVFAAQHWLDYYAALGPVEHTEIRTWAEFVPPPVSVIRHGVWLRDNLALAHAGAQSVRGYTEWTEGLPPEEIVDGKLRDQRASGHYNRPQGTQTWFMTNSALSDPLHTATNEEAATDAAGSGTTTVSIAAGTQMEGWTFISPSNEPLNNAWPTGTYRCQMNITTAGVDCTYGLKTIGALAGHFARVDSGISTEADVKEQVEAVFSGTGTKLATTGSYSWSGGSDTDRFEVLIVVGRAASMSSQTVVITNDSNSFLDGPWPALNVGQPYDKRWGGNPNSYSHALSPSRARW